MDSFLILNDQLKCLVEKHWRVSLPKSVIIDEFIAGISNNEHLPTSPLLQKPRAVVRKRNVESSPLEVPTIISTPKGLCIISSYVGRKGHGVWLLAVTGREGYATSLHQSLHALSDLFTCYFCSSSSPHLSEVLIKENFDMVHQILDEVVDDGRLTHTDVGVVKRLVKPKGWVDELVNAVTGTVTKGPTRDFVTTVPWRVTQPHYVNNEVFLDLVEEVDAVMESNRLVHATLSGNLYLTSNLSGTPDLLLHLSNTRTLDEDFVSFHPCVRLQRWKRDKVLSFVPFESGVEGGCGGRLMSYSVPVTNLNQLPLWIKGNLSHLNGKGTLQITLNPRIPLANVVIVVTLSSVAQVYARATMGEWRWEQVPGNVGRGLWGLGKIGEPQKERGLADGVISMTITYEMEPGCENPLPTIFADFHSFPGHTVSGLRIDTLQVLGEPYVPFKGSKMVVRSGRYTFRI